MDIDVQEVDFCEGQFKGESDGRMKLVGKIYKCQNLRLGKGRDAQTVVDISAKVLGGKSPGRNSSYGILDDP